MTVINAQADEGRASGGPNLSAAAPYQNSGVRLTQITGELIETARRTPQANLAVPWLAATRCVLVRGG